MDESKKKEFEQTLETYADSFLKTDNPRLIYEVSYMEVSMLHGRPKSAPKEVSLNDETAAKALYNLVVMSGDPERIGYNNAMSEIFRTIGNPFLPYQEELQAAIHEKLPIIESKLKDAIEQQEIQRRMRTGADVSAKDLYTHIASEPEIVSDALFGSKGRELLEDALRNAECKIDKSNAMSFIDAFNKNFKAFQTSFLDKAKDDSAKNDRHHNPHVSAKEREGIAEHAEAVAMAVAVLETSGSPADMAIAQKMQEHPERFVEYTKDIAAEITPDIIKTVGDKCRDIIDSVKNRLGSSSLNLPKVVHRMESDIMANSQDYAGISDKKSAACIRIFETNFFAEITETDLGRRSLSSAFEREVLDGKGHLHLAALAARNTAITNEITNEIDAQYNVNSAAEVSDEAFDKVFNTYLEIMAKGGWSAETLKTAAEEAVKAEHKTIENDLGKDMTD